MKKLPLNMENDSFALLSDRTNLTLRKATIKDEVERISGPADNTSFNDILPAIKYLNSLNEKTAQMQANEAEQREVNLQASEALKQVESLQQKSSLYSWLIIIAVIVLILIIVINK